VERGSNRQTHPLRSIGVGGTACRKGEPGNWGRPAWGGGRASDIVSTMVPAGVGQGRSMPIRLTQTPTKCGMHPVAGVKFGKGWRFHATRDSEQGPERVERVEAPVEAERKFVEVGL
jgi:hypothetical protein